MGSNSALQRVLSGATNKPISSCQVEAERGRGRPLGLVMVSSLRRRAERGQARTLFVVKQTIELTAIEDHRVAVSILPAFVYAVKDGTITPDHIIETTGKGATEKFQLYHLSEDPSEATNLFMQEPAKAKELFTELQTDLARGRSRP